MFCRRRFKCRFLSDFLKCCMPFGGPFGTMFQKKTVPEISLTTRAPQHENKTSSTCPEAPREAASRAHFSNKKQQFEHRFQQLLLELMSCARKCYWICFHGRCSKNCSNKWKGLMSKAHYWWSDRTWAKAWRIHIPNYRFVRPRNVTSCSRNLAFA